MAQTVEDAFFCQRQKRKSHFHNSHIIRAERVLHSEAASYCEAKRNNVSSAGGE